MNVAPGASFEAVLQHGTTGIAASLRVRIVDNSGTVTQAPSGTGISEIATGVYACARTAPTAAGQYSIIWDDGTLSGVLAVEDLRVTYSASGDSPAEPTGLQFATSEDLEARLGVSFSAEEASRANFLLTLASGIISDSVSQQLGLVEDDVLIMQAPWERSFTLPGRPVQEVSEVLLDGDPLTADTHYVVFGDELTRITGPFGPEHTLQITYTHGYPQASLPNVVRSTCLEMVVRVWSNPANVQAETMGSESTTYHATPGLLLTVDEEKNLRKHLRGGYGFKSEKLL